MECAATFDFVLEETPQIFYSHYMNAKAGAFKNPIVSKILFAFVIVASILLSACHKERTSPQVEMETLFELNYGNFEDELNAFEIPSAGRIRISVEMRDGFFYILNGEAKKIMELNSYGDLLALYYNESDNPRPSFAPLELTPNINSTKTAVPYAFNEATAIALDSRKYLYVADCLPQSRQEVDPETNQVMSEIVVRFDGDKKFLNYIGRQGLGGSPFPYIRDIFTTERDELVVLCSTTTGFFVYWFSPEGYLLYSIPIENSYVPNPYVGEKGETFFSLETIIPDLKERKLYLKVDYFASYIDESSRVQSGVEYFSTLVHPFDIEQRTFQTAIDVPPYAEVSTDRFSNETYQIPYGFLGVTETGWLCFIVSTQEGFRIQLVQENGQRILKRDIQMNRAETFFCDFDLSKEGIVSALIVRKEKALVCWWRLDSLLQALIKD